MEQDPTEPTGVRETTKTLQRNTVEARYRKAVAAMKLRVDDYMEWDDIAEVLGYPSGPHAQLQAEKAAKELFENDEGSMKVLRRYASRRLENLARSAHGKAMDEEHPEHLAAVDRELKVVAQWISLWGLAAPTEVVVSNPTSDQLAQWVAAVQGKKEIEEADIFAEEDIVDAELMENA